MNKAQLNKIFTQTNQEIEQEIEEDIDYNPPDVQLASKELVQEIDNLDKIQDADYARRVLQNTLTKAQQLLNVALRNAEDGKARDVEVASGVLNTVAALSEKLITIHSDINNMNKKTTDAGTGNTYINNQNKTVLISTHDLLNQVLEEQKDESEASND